MSYFEHTLKWYCEGYCKGGDNVQVTVNGSLISRDIWQSLNKKSFWPMKLGVTVTNTNWDQQTISPQTVTSLW